jgi:hypothetical protein
VLYVWEFLGLAVSARIICGAVRPVLDDLLPDEYREEDDGEEETDEDDTEEL